MYAVQSHGVLYEDSRFMAAFPALAQTSDGEILLVFRRAPDSRWLLGVDCDASSIDDDLKSQLFHWDPRSQLVSVQFDQKLQATTPARGLSVDGQAADQDASLLTLEDGSILLSSFSWYPMPPAFSKLAKAWGGKAYGGATNTGCSFIPWGSYVRRSEDGGKQWTEREYLPALAGAEPLVPGLRESSGGCVRGQAIFRDGEILIPSYGEVAGSYSTHILVSKDGGTSWKYRSRMASSDTLNLYEPSLTLCGDGTIIAWMRTDDHQDRMASARSADGGHTWNPYELHQCVGHPAHGLRLRSGKILLSYGYRHEPFGIRARLLNERGDDINDVEEIIIREDGVGTDLGYPWSIELEDGRVLIAYYFEAPNGLRHIAYSILIA